MAIPVTDDPQWGYLLAAIGRIEDKLEKLAQADAQKAAVIIGIKEDLHRVEQALELKIKEQKAAIEARLTPMENIADKVKAGKIVALAILALTLAISGFLGALGVIKDWLSK